MLKKRIIPILLYREPTLVKGKQFDSSRRVGTVLQAVRVFNQRDVDELCLLDVCATANGNGPDFDVIEDVARECGVPFSYGGGIRHLDDALKVLRFGADKIVLNTLALENPAIISEIAQKAGSQAVVVSVDVRLHEGNYVCFSHSGSISTSWRLSDWLLKVQEMGAGEVILTSIEHEGMMEGFNLLLLDELPKEFNLPLVINGGAGKLADFVPVAKNSYVSGIAASSVFFFTEVTPRDVRNLLATSGVEVRR
jgi:cyclase